MRRLTGFVVFTIMLLAGATVLCQRTHLVYAERQWQNTGVNVSEGDVVLILCRGLYAVSNPNYSESWMTPDGNADQTGGSPASMFLVPGASKHAVVCRVGSDGEGFGIGHFRRFSAPVSGPIYLAVNDQLPTGYIDNSGYAVATIIINCPNSFNTSGIGDTPGETTGAATLKQNYPNPFTPATTFEYTLPASAMVQVRVLGEEGRVLQTLFEGFDEAGTHQATWNGRLSDGAPAHPGVYFYQLVVNNETRTKKMLLIK
jgi:hypothetical protein